MERIRPTRDSDILKGWKEIGRHLHCSEKTAYRWWKTRGLPILTPVSRSEKAPILASKRALDAWLKGGIEHVFINSSSLTVLDKQARPLWAHEFPHTLRDCRPEEAEWRLHILDLEGTGNRGVLFAARFMSSSIPDTLFYFSAEGKIVWQLEAEPPLLRRDGRPFERAWTFKHVMVATLGNKQIIWAALGNDAGWAGCVLRIQANGTSSVHLANAGFVECVCPVTLPDGDFLIVCGENNDFDQAFVGILGADAPAATSVPGNRLVFIASPVHPPADHISTSSFQRQKQSALKENRMAMCVIYQSTGTALSSKWKQEKAELISDTTLLGTSNPVMFFPAAITNSSTVLSNRGAI